jgi:hypothetical protein
MLKNFNFFLTSALFLRSLSRIRIRIWNPHPHLESAFRMRILDADPGDQNHADPQHCIPVHIYIYIYKCRPFLYPVSPVLEWKELTMLEQVRYRTKPMQSGMFGVRYRTKILDADAGVSFLDADAELC